MYKMRGTKRQRSSKASRMKSRVRSRYSSRGRSRSAKRGRSRSAKRGRSRGQQGGYAQYQNNMPYTPSYSTGGLLSPASSALANPVPYQLLGKSPDNYNHFTGQGFPSRGWH